MDLPRRIDLARRLHALSYRHVGHADALLVGEDLPQTGQGLLVEVGLPGEGAETEVYFCDLSHEYVRINAEYTT